MSFVISVPQALVAAGADLADLGSSIGAANSAAATSTTQVVSAAADEVSEAVAALFAAHGRAYQVLMAPTLRPATPCTPRGNRRWPRSTRRSRR